MSSLFSDPARRGWAARSALVEDSRWIADVAFSTQGTELASYAALLLGHHFVRIVYEGAIAIRSTNQNVGWPPLAGLLDDQFSAITARARHVTKLLDDTKKSYEDVLADLADVYHHNVKTLTGKAPRPFRWLETDLGLFDLDGSLVGATMPIAYRLALDPGDQTLMAGEAISDVAHEWGTTTAVLMAATLEPPLTQPTMKVPEVKIGYRDVRASRYLAGRFESAFSNELKLLMLLIEGDLNTNRLLLPALSGGYETPAFRARVTTLHHALTALQKIVLRYPGIDSLSFRELRTLLGSAPVTGLLGPGGKKVRHRCVHYEIRGKSIQLDISLPMNGVVEAVAGRNFLEFDSEVRAVTDHLAGLLSTWQPTRD